VRNLLAAGVPIDGIGFQTHWRVTPLPESFAENLRRFTELGLEVAITELDVRIRLPATAERLAAQAETYGQAVRACLEVPGCVAVTLWGFTDGYSWAPRYHPGSGAATVFDAGYAPKPAYGAVAEALSG
jgi:endo-1,4-beta-xylanase